MTFRESTTHLFLYARCASAAACWACRCRYCSPCIACHSGLAWTQRPLLVPAQRAGWPSSVVASQLSAALTPACSFSQGFCCTCDAYSPTDLKRADIRCGAWWTLGLVDTQSAHCLRFDDEWWHAVSCWLPWAVEHTVGVAGSKALGCCHHIGHTVRGCAAVLSQAVHAASHAKGALPARACAGLPDRGICPQVPHQPQCDDRHGNPSCQRHV